MKAPITYIRDFIPDPNTAFNTLKNELQWERRDDAPRCEYYCNDFHNPYIYGNGRGRRTYDPRPYHPVVLDIRKKLETLLTSSFEVCFLNMYLNQSDHLGWHADDSPEMDDARPIITVSLGVEREIWFREIGTEEKLVEKLLLENGSVAIMKPGMQDAWQHRIPKAGFQCGERISLTFRGYLNHVSG